MAYIDQQISRANDTKNPKIHDPFESDDEFFEQEIFHQGQKLDDSDIYVVCKILKPNSAKINPKFNFKKEKNVDSDDETLKQRFDDYLQSDDSSSSDSSSEEDFEGDESPENEDSTSDTSRK